MGRLIGFDLNTEVMRQNHGSKRSRGRNSNRRNGPSRNQTFDSNGPSVRIRGNASQVHEKYLAMARDASSSGDRVSAENYLQHAEHYHRILAVQREEAEARAAASQQPSQQSSQRSNGNGRRPREEAQQETTGYGTEGLDQPELDEAEMPAFVTKKVPEPTETSTGNRENKVEADTESAVRED